MEPKNTKKEDSKKQKTEQKTQKRVWDAWPEREAGEALYLKPEFSKLGTKADKKRILGKANLTQQQVIEDIRKRFRKFKNTDEFKTYSMHGREQDVFKLDSALTFLSRKLSSYEDAQVPKKIYRAYKLANSVSLGNISRVESQLDMEYLKHVGGAVNLEMSSNVCKIAMQPKLKAIPPKIRKVIANCVRWGLAKTREKLLAEEKVDVSENLVPNSIELRMMKEERKRLEVSKKMEIALLERKVPGVLKFAEQEDQRRRQKTRDSLYNFRKEQKPLQSDKKNVNYLRGYHKSTEQLEYEKICVFYDEEFTRLDKKFKGLINERAKKIENNDYGGVWDNLLFKNSIWDSIEPQTIWHIRALQNVIRNYHIEISQTGDNEGEAAMGSIKSFSEEALNAIWEAGTG